MKHDDKLNAVFDRIKMHNLSINLKKCLFSKTEIKFLGFVLCNGKSKPDPERYQSIIDYNLPQNAKDLQRFIGMIRYFSNFIQNFSELIAPLYDKLNKFSPWLDNEIFVFNELTNKLTN